MSRKSVLTRVMSCLAVLLLAVGMVACGATQVSQDKEKTQEQTQTTQEQSTKAEPAKEPRGTGTYVAYNKNMFDKNVWNEPKTVEELETIMNDMLLSWLKMMQLKPCHLA